ncbi:hypothetical protein LCGC14_3100590 [marine sediment metagenome]|uniref:Uncharacterized protein n=1 Tax=marine sediment metagenome TaxID=412755 RepID=A0A0F8YY11_9ZZZZ
MKVEFELYFSQMAICEIEIPDDTKEDDWGDYISEHLEEADERHTDNPNYETIYVLNNDCEYGFKADRPQGGG